MDSTRVTSSLQGVSWGSQVVISQQPHTWMLQQQTRKQTNDMHC